MYYNVYDFSFGYHEPMTKLSPGHKCLQVSDYIRVLIRRNRLVEGAPLPTEQDLCGMFKCSRGTVRKAMDLLAAVGEVQRKRRAGTFVSKPYAGKSQPAYAAIISTVGNPFQAHFVQLLDRIVAERGESVYVHVTNDTHDFELEFIRHIAKFSPTSRVLKLATEPEYEEETRALLRSLGFSYVIINDFWTESLRDQHVAYDECAAVEMAVEHLAKLGHRCIGLLDAAGWTRTRLLDAFFKMLHALNLPAENGQVLLCSPSAVPPLEKYFWYGGANPTAIIAVYPAMAEKLLVGLRQLELRVPEDVSVTSIEGLPMETPIMGMDMTATVAPMRPMIERALRLLHQEREDGHVRQYLFRPDLHCGNTTGPCPDAAAEEKSRPVQKKARRVHMERRVSLKE